MNEEKKECAKAPFLIKGGNAVKLDKPIDSKLVVNGFGTFDDIDDFVCNALLGTIVETKKFRKTVQGVYVNESKRAVTVVLRNGASQTAICSPEDHFDVEVGFALALSRALFGSNSQMKKFLAKNAKSIKAKKKAKATAKKKAAKKPSTKAKSTEKEKEN